jgi:hypothetical protein
MALFDRFKSKIDPTVQALIERLASEDARARESAARELGSMGCEGVAAQPALEEALAETDGGRVPGASGRAVRRSARTRFERAGRPWGWLRRRGEQAREAPSPRKPAERALRTVRAYHQGTKHHLHRYASGRRSGLGDAARSVLALPRSTARFARAGRADRDEPRYEPAVVAG